MKEIVKKIMETEHAVREKIDRARGEAQKIIRDAEKRSREILEERRQDSARKAQELIAYMKREAEEEKARQIDKVKGGSPELIEKKNAEIDRAVGRVVDAVLGTSTD